MRATGIGHVVAGLASGEDAGSKTYVRMLRPGWPRESDSWLSGFLCASWPRENDSWLSGLVWATRLGPAKGSA